MQAETKRIYSVLYSERHENQATVKAGELVKAGAIGKVIQTVGLGPAPHEPEDAARPGSSSASATAASSATSRRTSSTSSCSSPARRRREIVASQVGNVHHPEYPGLEDFGDVMLRGDGGTGYIRVDWFTPDGLDTWGDGAPHHPRHRRLHRGPQERRHRRTRRAATTCSWSIRRRRATSTASQTCAAVRRAAGRRRAEPHRDGDAAGARVPRDGAGAQSRKAGGAGWDGRTEQGGGERLKAKG